MPFLLTLSSTSLLLLLLLLLLTLLYTLTHRLIFHPLSKYPGPLLAKLTNLHQTHHAYRGTRHLTFHALHAKHGPIVRYGPQSLSFNTSTALRTIYSHKANVAKARFYEAFWAGGPETASTHSAIDKAVHARKRRVLSNAFSHAAMKDMEGYILEHVRVFCRNLSPTPTSTPSAERKGFGEAVDLSDQANYLTFDIMGDLCFGKSFSMLSSPANRFAIDLIGNAAHRHLICGTCLPIHEWHLDKLLFRKIAQGRARYMQYSKAQAAERMRHHSSEDGVEQRKDFFHYLLKAKDPETGKGFSTAELWGESNLLIIAGSDTTSTALAATVFYLVHDEKRLTRLVGEIRNAFQDVEDIRTGPALSDIQYLRACIDEAMRLSPSVGGLLAREVQPGGMEIDGEFVPEGTIVGVPHYAIHHNPEYFPRPFDFWPERWIAGSDTDVTEQSVAAAQNAFCPFSVGPRGCIGKGMAYAELSLTLARMLYMYDMRLAPGTTRGEGRPDFETGRQRPGEFQLKDTFTSMKEGPLVQFRPRI